MYFHRWSLKSFTNLGYCAHFTFDKTCSGRLSDLPKFTQLIHVPGIKTGYIEFFNLGIPPSQ
jgi:hypothetical protein